MRVAILSDVHGNLRALETVLADVACFEVDEHWVVGDLVAHGPMPAASLVRLRGLRGLGAVRGNTDRYVLTGALSPFIPADAWGTRVEASRALGWTLGAISAVDHADWLARLPVERRVTLPGGTRVLMVHASPGTDDGPGLSDELSDQELSDAVAQADADLVLVGHTHVPMDRTVAGVRVVNPGSVSNPVAGSRSSTWTLLAADATGYRLEHRALPFDVDAFADDLRRSTYPGAEWLLGRLGR